MDHYAPCPCGSGKKLKFCCADLMAEMEKIQRMLSGQQSAACLEHLKLLLQKYPHRPSLLGLRAMLENELGHLDDAQQTISTFLDHHPDNRVALAEQAILQARKGDASNAVAPLQRALAGVQQIPARVGEAIGLVGQSLLIEGKFLAARAHLMLHAVLSGNEETRAVELLMRLMSNPQIHLLFKETMPLTACPEKVAWQGRFDAAVELARRGEWQQALAEFESLVEPSQDAPAVWKNVARIRGFLAQDIGAAEALRKLASLNVSEDDAVEAEALAQLIDPAIKVPLIDQVAITYTINHFDKLEMTLSKSSLSFQLPRKGVEALDQDGPTPRSAYYLLDRPLPETGKDLSIDNVPFVLGYALLYAKETDRETRLKFLIDRDNRYATTVERLRELAGTSLGKAQQEEVLSQSSTVQNSMGWSWCFPDDTSPEVRQQLMAKERRRRILDIWPQLPLPSLGGRTVAESVNDSPCRLAVLAAILLFELSEIKLNDEQDIHQLRKQLGLPSPDRIDPIGLDLTRIPLTRLSRIKTDRLPDEALASLFQRAQMTGAQHALQNLGMAVVGRQNLEDAIDRAEVYGVLAQLETDSQKQLELVALARQAAEGVGQSSAKWDLAEFALRLERGETSESQRLLRHLHREHIEEPGIPQAIHSILVQAGMVHADGTVVTPAPEETSTLVLPENEGEPSEIWTPGKDQPRKQKSTLWIPN